MTTTASPPTGGQPTAGTLGASPPAQTGAPQTPPSLTNNFRGSATGELLSPPPAAPPQEGAPPPAGQPAAVPPPVREPRQRVKTSDLGNDDVLRARLDRERVAVLRDLGVSDVAAFKRQQAEQRAELDRLKKAEEETKRAQMSEVQRLQADYEAEKRAREGLEARVRDAEDRAVSQEHESIVYGAAMKHVDPDMYDYARLDFKRYVEELERTDPKALEAMGPAQVEKFFRELVKKKPRLAPPPAPPVDSKPGIGRPHARADLATARRPAATLPQRPAPRPTVSQRPAPVPPPAAQAPFARRPLSSGGSNGAPPPAAQRQGADTNASGRTFKPGLPNSMTKEEVRAEMIQRGMKSFY